MRHPSAIAGLLAGAILVASLGVAKCHADQPAGVQSAHATDRAPTKGLVVEPAGSVPPRRFCPMSAFVKRLEIHSGVALIEAGDVLCGVDPVTLRELWRTRLCPRGLYVDDQQPRYAWLPDSVLVWRAGSTRGSATEMALATLDVRSGRMRWRYDAGFLQEIPRYRVTGDVLILMEGRGEQLTGNQHMACLELSTGKRRWALPNVRRFDMSSASDKHILLRFGRERNVRSLATGAPIAWDDLTEAERNALRQDGYLCGEVGCRVTELWSGAGERIAHINARELGACGFYFGRDVIVRMRRGQVINPDNPVDAIWSYRPPGQENAAQVAGSFSFDDSLVVMMNPIVLGDKSRVRARVIGIDRQDGQLRWA